MAKKFDYSLMETFYLVTSNQNKLRELSNLLGRSLEQIEAELSEIQTSDLRSLVTDKLRKAWEAFRKPIIVEDTSLYFEAWNGLPGPLVKWFVEHLGPEGMVRALQGFNNHSARAVCCLGFTRDGENLHFFEGEINGLIVHPRGSLGFGWDPVFQPEGARLTFGEMSETGKSNFSMRARAAIAFMNFLNGEAPRK